LLAIEIAFLVSQRLLRFLGGRMAPAGSARVMAACSEWTLTLVPEVGSAEALHSPKTSLVV